MVTKNVTIDQKRDIKNNYLDLIDRIIDVQNFFSTVIKVMKTKGQNEEWKFVPSGYKLSVNGS